MDGCKWEPNDGGMKCSVCGAWRTKRMRRNCRPGSPGRTSPGEVRARPKAAIKVAHPQRWHVLLWRYFFSQIRERLVAKAESLPQRVIDQRLAICKACPQYDPESHRCKLCGCCSGPSQKKWLNKLALASEDCPDEPPRWYRHEPGIRRWGMKLLKWLG